MPYFMCEEKGESCQKVFFTKGHHAKVCPDCKRERSIRISRANYRTKIGRPIRIKVESFEPPDPTRAEMWMDGVCRRCGTRMFSSWIINQGKRVEELKCIMCGEWA
jgi:hypothetical protein